MNSHFVAKYFATLLGFVMLTSSVIFGFYFGVSSLIECFSFPDVISFDSRLVFALATPLLFGPIVILSIYFLIFRRQAPDKLQEALAKVIYYSFIITFISMLVFSIGYPRYLTTYGYSYCSKLTHLPSGVRVYVADQSFCTRK